MKFKLGNLEVETSDAYGTNDFHQYRVGHPGLIGRLPRAVYFWDCRLAPKGNPVKPTYFVTEPNLTLTVLTAAGREDQTATQALFRRLLAASGAADIPALNAMLLQNFPPLMVRIPWQRLDDMFLSTYSVRVIAWVDYKDMFLTPTHGPQQDRYLLSYPAAVRFAAIVVGFCAPKPMILIPPRDISVGMTLTPGTGTPKDFTDEFDRKLTDRIRENPGGMGRLRTRYKSETETREKRYRDKIARDFDDIMDELDDW